MSTPSSSSQDCCTDQSELSGPTMSSLQSARLESALRTVRESGVSGFKTRVEFTIAQPKNGAWNV